MSLLLEALEAEGRPDEAPDWMREQDRHNFLTRLSGALFFCLLGARQMEKEVDDYFDALCVEVG